MSEEQKIKARERSKIYYQKNKEKILARQKKYVRERYQNDEEYRKRTLENHKRYEENNKEKVKEIKRNAQRKYYEKHKDYYKEKCGGWYKKKCDLLQSKIDKANEILNKLCVMKPWNDSKDEMRKIYRPIKNTSKQEVYKTICDLKNILKEEK